MKSSCSVVTIHLADNEYGNELMDRVAREAFVE